MVTLQSAQSAFLRHCAEERKFSPHTLKAYRLDLIALARFIATIEPKPSWGHITREHLRDYLRTLSHRRPRTLRRKLASLKSFFRFASSDGLLTADPAHDLRSGVRLGKPLPRTVPRHGVRRIFTTVYQRPLTRKRRQLARQKCAIALVELLYCTGLRVSEVSRLQLASVDLRQNAILVDGKGSRERIVPIVSSELRRALLVWLDHRLRRDCESPYLFVNRFGNRLSEQSIRAIVRRAATLGGVGRVTPHMFRHTLATELLEQGVDLRHIQHLLGHSSISTTTIYAHVSDRAQRETLLLRHPRRFLGIRSLHEPPDN